MQYVGCEELTDISTWEIIGERLGQTCQTRFEFEMEYLPQCWHWYPIRPKLHLLRVPLAVPS